MKALLPRCLRRGADPAQWREATRQASAGQNSTALTFPRPEPLALLVIGMEARPLQTMARLALSEFRRQDGAEYVDATGDAEQERDRQVDEIIQGMDGRRHLVIAARYASAAAYHELLKLLGGAGYTVAALLLAPRRRESMDPSLAPLAAALEKAYDDLTEHAEVAWLVPGKPNATRRANRLGRRALGEFGPGEPPPESAEEGPSDPLIWQRWECLQILRRRASQEQGTS